MNVLVLIMPSTLAEPKVVIFYYSRRKKRLSGRLVIKGESDKVGVVAFLRLAEVCLWSRFVLLSWLF
jgi:hypothetical protein